MSQRSPVPLIQEHVSDDFVSRLERLKDEAEAGGDTMLAYLIGLATLEAKRSSDRARRDTDETAPTSPICDARGSEPTGRIVRAHPMGPKARGGAVLETLSPDEPEP